MERLRKKINFKLWLKINGVSNQVQTTCSRSVLGRTMTDKNLNTIYWELSSCLGKDYDWQKLEHNLLRIVKLARQWLSNFLKTSILKLERVFRLIGTEMHEDVNGHKNGWNFNACLDERNCMSIGTFTKLFRYVS